MKFGFAMIAQLSKLANGGLESIGVALVDMMPAATEVMVYQRQVTLLLDLAASINKTAGNVVARALMSQRDVSPKDHAEIVEGMRNLFQMVNGMQNANRSDATLPQALAMAYGGVMPPADPSAGVPNEINGVAGHG